MADDGEDKPFDPSQKRLNQLRRDGQVPRSQEMSGAVQLVVLIAYLLGTKDQLFNAFATAFRDVPVFMPIDFWDRAARAGSMMTTLTLQLIIPYMAIVLVTAVATTILDVGGFLFSTKSLTPNFTKFNPATGIKNLFTLKNLLDLLKSAIKLVVLLAVVRNIVENHLNDAFWAPTCGVTCVFAVGWRMMWLIIIIGIALMVVGAVIDFALSRWMFKRDNKMSLTEMKKESKEDSGDPHIRSARNQERKKAADSAGLVGTKAMNIVFLGDGIVVGVAYKPDKSGVPMVAAKRADPAALKEFLQIAKDREVPVVTDPAVTALLLKGRVGEPIPRDTFTPVAQYLVKNGVTG